MYDLCRVIPKKKEVRRDVWVQHEIYGGEATCLGRDVRNTLEARASFSAGLE